MSAVFGLQGEVKVFLHRPEVWSEPRQVTLRRADGTTTATRCSLRSGAGKRIIGRFDCASTREEAALLCGARIEIDAARLPALDAGEFYVRDVIGLPVVHGGVTVGVVRDVHATEGHDVLEVGVGEDVEFVPCVAGLVRVDVEKGHVELVEVPW